MHNPRTFLCYPPRAGLRCAVAYLPNEHDAYGWFTGLADGQPASAYFVLEDFYSPREPRYVSVAGRDLHSKWTRDEAMCHELAELQEAFSGEWLFSRSDPRGAVELERYAEAEHAVLKGLARRWPLDYRVA